MLGFGLRRGADGAGLRELGWLQSKAERASAGKKQSRPADGKAGPQAETEDGEESYSFIFLIFFKASSKCNFNSIRNPTSNQAIQNNMQRHECTFMVVDLYLILFLIKLLFPKFKCP